MSMNAKITVAGNLSVCVCTRNRPEELAKCIASVRGCGNSIYEIVVSDDSTDNRTKEMVQNHFPDVVYVRGPKKGLGANRNCAIEHSCGEFLIFLDDDSEIDKNFVSAVDKFADENNLDLRKTMITGNQVEGGVSIQPHDQSFLGFQNVPYMDGDVINTVNIMATVFPRKLVNLVRFDELLVYGYDEVDICARCRQQAAVVRYCQKANVYHYPSAVNRDYYTPYTEASRIYVTFKRYRIENDIKIKSWCFLVAAMVHLLLSRVKREGYKGVSSFLSIATKALGYIRTNEKLSSAVNAVNKFSH